MPEIGRVAVGALLTNPADDSLLYRLAGFAVAQQYVNLLERPEALHAKTLPKPLVLLGLSLYEALVASTYLPGDT